MKDFGGCTCAPQIGGENKSWPETLPGWAKRVLNTHVGLGFLHCWLQHALLVGMHAARLVDCYWSVIRMNRSSALTVSLLART